MYTTYCMYIMICNCNANVHIYGLLGMRIRYSKRPVPNSLMIGLDVATPLYVQCPSTACVLDSQYSVW